MKTIFLNKFFFICTIILLVILLVLFNMSSISSYNEILVSELPKKENLTGRDLEIQKKFEENKLIAMTFDDGPGVYTEYLVDELKKREIPSTFFILGTSAKQHPHLLNKIAENNEIAMHGYSHKLFTKLNDNEILSEIQKVEELIVKNTNIAPKLIRAPYGSLNNRVKSLIKEHGYISVNWTVDSKDWNYRNTEKTYNHVIKSFHGNDIILMHDIYKTSVDCALELIDYYKEKGYMFVTVTELLKAKGEYNI